MKSLVRSKLALVAAIMALVILLVAAFGTHLTPHDPSAINLRARHMPPAWVNGGSLDHPLGTDGVGRDVLSRLIVATRMSVLVGVASVILGGIIGISAGTVAGYFGGPVDALIMRVIDVQLAYPTMLIGLVAMALLGTGVPELILVIAVTQWAYYARVVRGEILKIRELDYFVAATALGAGSLRMIRKHVLPNAVSSSVVVASFSLASAIFYEAALSFFGLGIPASTPTWGNILADARDLMLLNAWYSVFPGLAITVTVLSFNILGDWLRDYLDVKQAD